MWFKNLKIFRFTSEFSLNTDTLQSQLERMVFKPCSSQEIQTMGFINPVPNGELLFHAANNAVGICLKREEKILPASVVNGELSEKVKKIEQDTGSPVGKKAQKDLKEDIIQSLLPRAFSKTSHTNAVILLDRQVVVVDASSDGAAEVVLSCLRKCIESLPVVPFVKSQQQHVLTDWLKHDAPDCIELLDEAEFKSTADDGAIARVKKQDLDADEVLAHIQAGKLVEKIAVSYKDRLTCIIAEDLGIKRLKFTDIVMQENEDIPKDEVAAKFDADFSLFSAEVSEFIDDLDKIFAEE
ncbi:recombination-associated protein RdgC [Agaribacter marinus]|uniref:Recombination-associated protein RdgC n=1 Tax=Agaribacter marinus TaxID=1431249 RepID=A0AA37T059_9ALTE|nr:recombination-associated protein RdgC [Agaribacter marinus]GLR71175.1 recombination-associated protein RdgC [Agaribacter marinus]